MDLQKTEDQSFSPSVFLPFSPLAYQAKNILTMNDEQIIFKKGK